MNKKITKAIQDNKIHPTQFQISSEEYNFLCHHQDDLFDKLNNLGITFIESNSDTIMVHFIIAQRIKPEITINEFIGIYSKIKSLIQS